MQVERNTQLIAKRTYRAAKAQQVLLSSLTPVRPLDYFPSKVTMSSLLPIDSYTSPVEGLFIFFIYYLIYKAGLRAQKLMWLLNLEDSLPRLWQRSVKIYISLLAEIQKRPRDVVAQNVIPCDQQSSSASSSVILAPFTSLKFFLRWSSLNIESKVSSSILLLASYDPILWSFSYC